MAMLIRCDRCQSEVHDARINKIGLDGFEISVNRFRIVDSGERADLCESCLREIMTTGKAVE